jgi:predicted nucleic acid-binding protein
MKRSVIDANVVLKWYLPDERDGERALHVLHQFLSEDLDIFAPALMAYEVLNGLVTARRRGRIQEEEIHSAMEGFINLGIKLFGLSEDYPRVIYFCKKFSRSAYDASYLALAEKEGIPFVTADESLYHSVKKDLSWVKWLGEG